ncbi:hypothetical protein HJFPF1_06489 [Paramyrothecium foliicola]|nr:hypothetical protein HJFPF1_06489 [Paramyrothecium foliicola]
MGQQSPPRKVQVSQKLQSSPKTTNKGPANARAEKEMQAMPSKPQPMQTSSTKKLVSEKPQTLNEMFKFRAASASATATALPAKPSVPFRAFAPTPTQVQSSPSKNNSASQPGPSPLVAVKPQGHNSTGNSAAFVTKARDQTQRSNMLGNPIFLTPTLPSKPPTMKSLLPERPASQTGSSTASLNGKPTPKSPSKSPSKGASRENSTPFGGPSTPPRSASVPQQTQNKLSPFKIPFGAGSHEDHMPLTKPATPKSSNKPATPKSPHNPTTPKSPSKPVISQMGPSSRVWATMKPETKPIEDSIVVAILPRAPVVSNKEPISNTSEPDTSPSRREMPPPRMKSSSKPRRKTSLLDRLRKYP